MTIKSLIKRNYEKQPQLEYPDYKSSILRAPKKDKFFFPSSPSETSGPKFNKIDIECDLVEKTAGFRVPIKEAIALYGTLRGTLSGLSIPTFVVFTLWLP